MPKAGYLTVFGMLLLAAILATFNLLYQRQRTVNTLIYWGQAHRPIVAADNVEMALLEPADANTVNPGNAGPVKFVTIDQVRYREVQTKPGADARGLLHIRRALVDDGAYLWDQSPPPGEPLRFCYALRFIEHDEPSATVFFSSDGNWVRSAGSDRTLAVKPNDRNESPFLSFLQEQFEPAPPGGASAQDRATAP